MTLLLLKGAGSSLISRLIKILYWLCGISFIAGLISLVFFLHFLSSEKIKDYNGFEDLRFVNSYLQFACELEDVWGLDLYLEDRLADIVVESDQDFSKYISYRYTLSTIKSSTNKRSVDDLRLLFYRLNRSEFDKGSQFVKWLKHVDYKIKSIFLSKNTKLYYYFRQKMLPTLVKLKKKEDGKTKDEVVSMYNNLLDNSDYEAFRELFLLRMAFLVYKEDVNKAKEYLEKVRKHSKHLPFHINRLQKYLNLKIKDSEENRLVNKNHSRALENQVSRYLNAIGEYESREFSKFSKSLDNLYRLTGDPLARSILMYQNWSSQYYGNEDVVLAEEKSNRLKEKNPIDILSYPENMKRVVGDSCDEEVKYIFKYNLIQNPNLKTKLMVYEGEVYVIEIQRDGTRVLTDVVEGGESVEIKSQKEKKRGLFGLIKDFILGKSRSDGVKTEFNFILEIINKFFPQAVEVFKVKVGLLAQRLLEDEFTRFYSEEEFGEYVIETIESKFSHYFSDIRIEIDEEGFHGVGNIHVGPIKLKGQGSGIVLVGDEQGKLEINLKYIKIVGLDMPRFMLDQLEKDFETEVNRQELPLEILEMKYSDGGILITCKKTQSSSRVSAGSDGQYAY